MNDPNNEKLLTSVIKQVAQDPRLPDHLRQAQRDRLMQRNKAGK